MKRTKFGVYNRLSQIKKIVKESDSIDLNWLNCELDIIKIRIK